MQKQIQFLRALTVPVASAFALAACAPQLATMPTVKPEGPSAGNVSTPAFKAPEVPAVGTVSGLVKTYNVSTHRFEPVAGAAVKVEGTSLTATTDAEGRYTLVGVAAGGQKLSVSKAGQVATRAIAVSPVSGLANVNLALEGRQYALQGASPQRQLTLTGVVSDPRGVALPNAEVTALTTSGTINIEGASSREAKGSATAAAVLQADSAGYFVFYVGDSDANNEILEADGNTQVRLDARGRTAGGLEVELSGDAAVAFTYAEGNSGADSQVADLQCNTFPAVGKPAMVADAARGLALVPGELATIEVPAHLSQRADELFIRIHTGLTPDQAAAVTVHDVLPISLTPDLQVPGKGQLQFRVPFSIGTSSNVRIQVCQLGLVPTTEPATASSGGGLGPLSEPAQSWAFSEADYVRDLSGALDATWEGAENAVGSRYVQHLAVNPGLVAAPGEVATASLDLGNANVNVPVEVEVSFKVPSRVEVSGAVFGTDNDGGIEGPDSLAPASLVAGADADGFTPYTAKGLLLPANSATARRRLDLGLKVKAGDSRAGGELLVKDLAITYPARGFTEAQAGQASLPLYGTLIENDETKGYQVSKKYHDIEPGVVDVELTITPPASAAMQALRLADITPVELAPVAASVTSSGTITPGDADSGGALTVTVGAVPYTLSLASGTYTSVDGIITGLETALGNLNNPPFTIAATNPAGGIKFEATNGAAALTVASANGTTLAETLKLQDGLVVASQARYEVEALPAASVSVTQGGTAALDGLAGGQAWTFAAAGSDQAAFSLVGDGQSGGDSAAIPLPSLGKHLVSSSQNLVVAAFELTPPNEAATDRTAPIRVRYRLKSLDIIGTQLDESTTPIKAGTIVADGDVDGASTTRILASKFKGTTWLTDTLGSGTSAPAYPVTPAANTGIRQQP
ncbi:MAG: carboxypeptidase regulatory-like domain-containing protein [Candidatus Sericytochromatia bacterium]|nr:carboxypeptidase regulatory-like domain-containing protein [Candidatus Sericytochromatia bacterium]